MAAGLGGAIGGIYGGIGGLTAGIEQKTLAARSRRGFRKGQRRGEAQAQREVYDILNSPEYSAVKQFVYGTFGIPMGGPGGAGGTTFGGVDYDERPTGVALEGTRKKSAMQLAKQLARGYNAQERAMSGLSLTGQPLPDVQDMLDSIVQGNAGNISKKDQKILAGIAPYLQRAGGLNDMEKEIVNRHFARRTGVTLDQGLERLTPSTGGPVSVDPATGGPVNIDPGSTQNVQTAGGPATAAAAAAGPQYGPGFGFDSPLARDFRAGLAQAQTSRGLYSSNAAANAEASGLAMVNFQQQAALLPFMLGLAQAPSQLYQSLRGQNANAEILRGSGGAQGYGITPGNAPVSIYGGLVQGISAGAGGGAAIGAAVQQGQQNQQYLDYLTSQQQQQQGGGGGGAASGSFI